MPTENKTDRVRRNIGHRCLVLVGMMGAGKTTIGRRLATRLNLPFVDVDQEIENAAGQSIVDIFAQHGEDYFRAGEQRVFLRLLGEGPSILATGGGTFMNDETRKQVSKLGISIWLKADFDILYKRVSRRNHRPLLQTDDPKQALLDLITARDPIYAEADIIVKSRDVPHEKVVSEIVELVDDHLDTEIGASTRREQKP
ncbi:MAG: shikimate kinase [Rhizobiales bacterium]|nr:shikimate kinase [Hyphomicrobiales bacterium]